MLRERVGNLLERGLDHLQYRRASQKPSQIHLSVTDRCFLPCLHCDIWKNETVDLPKQDWLDVIDQLGKWCAPSGMNFVGGEPLLRTDLEELIQRAKYWGFETSFNTNGWLVTEKRAKSLAESGVDLVYVSLDGLEKETIDHSRGREGSFEKAMEAISYFLEQSVPQVMVASVLHARNAGEFLRLLDWVEQRGMRLVLQPLYQNFGENDYDPDWWKSSELWWKTEEELQAIEATLDQLTIARMKGRGICNDAKQLQAMKFHFRNPQRDTGASCRAGHSDLSFDPQGNIRLCYFLEPVGHIHDETPISWVWEQRETLRRRWQVSRCERHCSLLNCNFEASS